MKKINVLAILVAVVIILSVPLCAFAEKADDANVVTEISENNIEQDNKSNNDVETKKVISTFKDVSYDTHSWAIDAIESMADQGLIKGYSDGTFKPDNTVSKLEALSLVARVLGVQDPENSVVVDAGIEAYYDLVDTYNLNFGTNEVCYLLIKNVISEEELSEYIDKSHANDGMKRYEMAVLLTKALDADSEVSKNLITTLEFDDADEIPAYAKKYVEYINNCGLMNGVGNNMFSPDTDVTRAQVAILMSKLLDMTKYTFKSGTVAEMDTSTRVIRIKNEAETLKYTVNAGVILRFEGVDITINDIAGGYDAVITFKDESLYAIDFVTPLVDKEVKGILASTSNASKPSITISVIGDNDVDISSDVKETYPLSSNLVVSYNESASSLKSLKNGTFVTVVVKKGEAVSIRGYDKTKTESGRISAVEITPVCKLSIELNDGSEVTYIVSSDVEVSRNGSKATAADVLSGDSVAITTTYDRITKIVASSKEQTKAGVIQEVIISANPRITIKSVDGNITYNITNNCILDLPGITSPSFYDLRVGVAVDLTIEGDTVVKLSSNIAEGISQITGTVVSVNSSYSVIQVNFVDATTGISVTEPVFVKSKATIIDIVTGSSLKLGSIKTGAKVTAFGVRNSGVFEATTVNVTNN